MDKEIKTLTEPKRQSPPLWTMFEDATGGISYTRVVGFMVAVVFFFVWAYLSITTETMIVPPKEMVYILVAFAAAKPVQRFAESKEVETQLNYDFQIAQLDSPVDKPPGT